MNYSEIYGEALKAAQEAAAKENASLPPENARGFDCGFAWVQFKPATHPFIKWAKENGHGQKHWNSGWYFWGSSLHGINTQSISVNQAAAKAFRLVLEARLLGEARAHTIFVGSRYD